MRECSAVVYRYCKTCRRATRRFTIGWMESERVDPVANKTKAQEAVLAAEARGVCDACRKQAGRA